MVNTLGEMAKQACKLTVVIFDKGRLRIFSFLGETANMQMHCVLKETSPVQPASETVSFMRNAKW